MDVQKAIEIRRSYRSIEKFPVTPEILHDLAEAASLAPSCFNNQPWRFVFVYDQKVLEGLYAALTEGNYWMKFGSMLIAVCSKKELDCEAEGRVYNLFDTGMAVGQMMLRATELGLVAHAVVGYNEEIVKKVLHIPQDLQVITLLAVGKKNKSENAGYSGSIPDPWRIRSYSTEYLFALGTSRVIRKRICTAHSLRAVEQSISIRIRLPRISSVNLHFPFVRQSV